MYFCKKVEAVKLQIEGITENRFVFCIWDISIIGEQWMIQIKLSLELMKGNSSTKLAYKISLRGKS